MIIFAHSLLGNMDNLYHNNSKFSQIMAYVINDECVACGTCQGECPTSSISEGDIYVIEPTSCIDCGACADVCPAGAISPGE